LPATLASSPVDGFFIVTVRSSTLSAAELVVLGLAFGVVLGFGLALGFEKI
jgi:high-affinity Fe2+/Pb2+ permease